MTTFEEHAVAVAQLVESLAPRLTSRVREVDAAAVAKRPRRYAARVLAADVWAGIDVPRFDNSQMDGFAVRSEETLAASPKHPVSLPVGDPIAAGDAPGELPLGVARPVMTGAPIPLGADAVIPVERTADGSFEGSRVTFTEAPEAGQFVRPRAADVSAGTVLAHASDPLGIAALGAFAAAGVTRVTLRRRPRVAIITTGRELAPTADEGALAPGTIPDAIAGMLASAIDRAGAKARAVRCSNDDPERFITELDTVRGWADLIVTVGGISKGAYEVVRLALAPLGVTFSHVAMQPGGPQGIGVLPGNSSHGETPVLCFPGNPVSALISFESFLRAPLRELTGLRPAVRRTEQMPLAEAITSPPHQHQLRRGVLTGDGRVRPLGGPGSHLIAHYGASDAIIHVPLGVSDFNVDDTVKVWIIDD